MSNLTPIDPDSDVWRSWINYKNSDDFAAVEKWASHPQHRLGALWAVYAQAYADAEEAGRCPLIAILAVTFCGFGVGLTVGVFL